MAFLPVYTVLMLPCVFFQLIRKEKSGHNVVRKFFNIEDTNMGGTGDNKELQNGEDLKCESEGIPLTNEHLKSRLNTRRASSIEGENEMIGMLRSQTDILRVVVSIITPSQITAKI